jgi:hypothetical protein
MNVTHPAQFNRLIDTFLQAQPVAARPAA